MAIGNGVVTVDQAAEIIGCSRIWVRKLANAGEIAGERIGGNSNAPWLLDRTSVEKYAAKDIATGSPRGPRGPKNPGKKRKNKARK